MPIDLHQRLSEFSYGYGVSREVEGLLTSIGLNVVPFLPSLLEEAKVGFDVAFERYGIPLLLQFKLREALKRFRRSDISRPAPLWGEHWRFHVDTAEADGQFDLLLKAERAETEVYYVAPRFASWDSYATAFEERQVLESSLLISPAEIDQKLASQGEPDGWHRVVYDRSDVFVCSEPIQLQEQSIEHLAENIREHIERLSQSIDTVLRNVYAALGRRRQIRTRAGPEDDTTDTFQLFSAFTGLSLEEFADHRERRLDALRSRSDHEADAIFALSGSRHGLPELS